MAVSGRMLGGALLVAGAALGVAWFGLTRGDGDTSTGYAVVAGWPALPAGLELGQVSGVGVGPAGDVLVFHRGAHDWDGGPVPPNETVPSDTLTRLASPTGAPLGAWGAGRFVVPHGLAVGPDGDIWLTDVGLHQVFEVDPDGRVLRVLGERGVAGDDETHFDMPTDVAFAPDGSIYVSDGYGNARVVKLSRGGRYLGEWGTPGSAPGQFDTPHGIAVDADGRVYVADRGNARLQVFTGDGRLLDVWEGDAYGRPWAVRIGADGRVYVVDGGDERGLPGRARVLVCDRDGNVLEEIGSYGSAPGEFEWPHAIAVAADGSLYVGEIENERVQKLTRARTER